MTFLARKYRLGSFKQKQNATWEFVISDEKIDEAAVRAELSSRWRWDRRTPLWRPHHRSAGLSGTRPRTLLRAGAGITSHFHANGAIGSIPWLPDSPTRQKL